MIEPVIGSRAGALATGDIAHRAGHRKMPLIQSSSDHGRKGNGWEDESDTAVSNTTYSFKSAIIVSPVKSIAR